MFKFENSLVCVRVTPHFITYAAKTIKKVVHEMRDFKQHESCLSMASRILSLKSKTILNYCAGFFHR